MKSSIESRGIPQKTRPNGASETTDPKNFSRGDCRVTRTRAPGRNATSEPSAEMICGKASCAGLKSGAIPRLSLVSQGESRICRRTDCKVEWDYNRTLQSQQRCRRVAQLVRALP